MKGSSPSEVMIYGIRAEVQFKNIAIPGRWSLRFTGVASPTPLDRRYASPQTAVGDSSGKPGIATDRC